MGFTQLTPANATDLGVINASPVTFTLGAATRYATAVLTAGTESSIQVNGLVKNRHAVLRFTQAAAANNAGTVKINGEVVPTDPIAASLTVVWVWTDGTNVDYVSSYGADGGSSSGGGGSTGPGTYIRTLRASGNPLTTGTALDWFTVPAASEIMGISASSDGTPATFDVNIDGTTVFTTQSNRPSVNSGNDYFAIERTANVIQLPPASRVTLDIDATGTGGGDLIAAGPNNQVSATSTGAKTVTVGMPSGTLPNNSLLLWPVVVYGSTGYPTVTTPTGWTALTGSPRQYLNGTTYTSHSVFWKLRDGSEGADESITMTAFTGGNISFHNTEIYAYSAADPTGTLDVTSNAQTGASTTVTAAALTATTTTGLRVVSFRFPSASLVSAPANTIQPGNMPFFTRKITASGSTGTDVITISAGVVSTYFAAVFKTTSSSASGAGNVKVDVRVREI
jgi:hypothetical protein